MKKVRLGVIGTGEKINESKFDYLGSYTGEFRDFHSAITEGKPVRSTFEQGGKDFETMLTVLKIAGGSN